MQERFSNSVGYLDFLNSFWLIPSFLVYIVTFHYRNLGFVPAYLSTFCIDILYNI
jgi:hypothetical protein